MLRLILGKAGTGKTAFIIEEIAQAVKNRQGGRILLVPEQYSHEAERELCAACGDSLSLYAEVLSFTGLARQVETRTGGGAARLLDKGGRLLCMSQALGSVGPRLRVYSQAQRRAELQISLLEALDELKAACITPERLEEAAGLCGDSFGKKLSDLALIYAAYDAAVANGHADPADRLSALAEVIGQEGLGAGLSVYVDGFVDFTLQEHRVLSALLQTGAELTVCSTVDALDGLNEIYELSRRSCRRLAAQAKELGIPVQTEYQQEDSETDQLRFYADRLFGFEPGDFTGETGKIRLFCGESKSAECEFAAAEALRLVREEGCRWRDIAVAVRGFEDYRGTLENVFRLYGVPLFLTRKSELLSKPLPALISLAYEIVEGGWNVDDVISCVRTGLSGLSAAEGDELAAYVYKWQLRAPAWEGERDWRQHPDGYGHELDQEALDRLEEINRLRRRFSGPLLRFQRQGRAAATGEEQAAALAGLLTELELPRQLSERAAELESGGMEERGRELRQIWDLTVSALEQSAAILGSTELGMADFGRLFTRMLSMYDVGTIPVSLDRVSAGDFDRMRRRRIKHLLVLGCSDDRLPQTEAGGGIFTEEERQRLLAMDLGLAGGESELWREFSLIYHCLSLPSRSLCLSYAALGEDGEERRPSFVISRAEALFGMQARPVDLDDARLSAPAPALALAAHSFRGGGRAAASAAAYFRETEPERFERLRAASRMDRGQLSRAAVESLYGARLRLSASRIDKFAACRFAYFCRYGLKAQPFEPASFDRPDVGVFMHDILEKTAGEVAARGGFRQVSDGELREIVKSRVADYIDRELNGFGEKSARFVYLFKRLEGDVQQVVADMADELRRSDFVPLDFELDFSKARELGELALGQGEESLRLTGIADRVDGWVHDGKLYLRVVDYKSGSKKFSLTDVYYGMGLQMLLYLFALEEGGKNRYGREIVPAGVIYVPARNDLVAAEHELDGEEAERARKNKLRRSGFVLDDPELIQAWEQGEEQQYIPLLNARSRQVNAATAAQIGALCGRVKKTLAHMAGELRRGSIAADPYYRSRQENACENCEFAGACHFTDGENGERFRILPAKRPEEVWGPAEGGEEHEHV